MKTVLNKQQIREICRAYENGEVKRTIYERYSISQKRLGMNRICTMTICRDGRKEHF